MKQRQLKSWSSTCRNDSFSEIQCTCVTDTIKDSPLDCVDDACLARERKTVVKTRVKHARTAAKLIMLNKQNRQLRRLLGLSPSLTVYQ